jgi:hypothetical protein
VLVVKPRNLRTQSGWTLTKRFLAKYPWEGHSAVRFRAENP